RLCAGGTVFRRPVHVGCGEYRAHVVRTCNTPELRNIHGRKGRVARPFFVSYGWHISTLRTAMLRLLREPPSEQDKRAASVRNASCCAAASGKHRRKRKNAVCGFMILT